MFGTPNSILATIEHDVHRRRRDTYSNFFSKQSIRKHSDVIQAAVDQLCARFGEYQRDQKAINLMHAYTAMTGDVVSGYWQVNYWLEHVRCLNPGDISQLMKHLQACNTDSDIYLASQGLTACWISLSSHLTTMITGSQFSAIVTCRNNSHGSFRSCCRFLGGSSNDIYLIWL